MSYSHLETFPAKPPGRDYLYQPFTLDQWNKSSFASERELAWFKDARYGMFIHFGLSSSLLSHKLSREYQGSLIG